MPNPSSHTSLKPDLGAHFRRSGYSGNPIDFGDVPTDHITFLDEATMSITGTAVYDGSEYAVTFDIPMTLFEELFASAPASVIHVVTSGLERPHNFPATIVLPELFRVGVRARLGQPVRGAFEDFIPFIVSEVLPSLPR